MVRQIIKYGAPELVRPSEAIARFDDTLQALAEDMLETMYAAEGVGLAAPQVALNIRLMVVDPSGGQSVGQQHVFVNPEITLAEGSQAGEEGCLSIPGFTAIVERPLRIHVRAQDVVGKPFEMDADQYLARAICHEVDHLEGVLYLDRISPLKREMIKRKIRKLQKAGEW